MKTPRIAALLAVVALTATACSSGGAGDTAASPAASGTSASPSAVDLVAGDKLTVCTNPPFAPFEFEENGEIVGLDMDITAEIAKDLGVSQQILNVGFDALESGAALNSGQCDIAATGMSINEARSKNVDFSTPYFTADLGVLAAAGSGLETVESLAGKKIAVQVGTVGKSWVADNDLTGVEFADLGLQVQALKTGQVDAVITDLFVLGPYVDDAYALTGTISTEDVYGLAVKKGNAALLEAVNATLERITTDGTYDAIHTARIGIAPQD